MKVLARWGLLALAAAVSFVELDYGLVLLAILFAVWTPPKSPYRAINIVLACEFVFTLGVIEWTIYKEIPQDVVWIYVAKMMKDCIFAAVFVYFRGRWLARISWLMGLFHLTIVITILNGGVVAEVAYVPLMALFCLAQLLCGFIGLIHGTAHCGIFSSAAGNLNSYRAER